MQPTPCAEVNALLLALLRQVREVLGDAFVGLYLEGSLANGAFDEASDVDFVAATRVELDVARFAALDAVHRRIAAGDSSWAIQLEGSYLSLPALRRHDPALTMHPNIERGPGERLKMAEHGRDWDIHRYILREWGITLAGPPARELVDPVSLEKLRLAALDTLHGWWARCLEDPSPLASPGYQSYAVLSLCRILYTLAHGAVASKPEAARWAEGALGAEWAPLIRRAWERRSGPASGAAAADIRETLDLLRYVLHSSA